MDTNVHAWDALQWQTILPGYRAKFIHSANMSFVLWNIDAHATLPEHAHPHEQVTHMLNGEYEITVDGRTILLRAGQLVIIPSHAKHSGVAKSDCQLLDTFYPIREDYQSEREIVLTKSHHSS